MSDLPGDKTCSDRLRELLYPLALFLAVGSLWGYAWAQHRITQNAHDYLPPLIDDAEIACLINAGHDEAPLDEPPPPHLPPPRLPPPLATLQPAG